MKTFYIATPQDFQNGSQHFVNSHYIDLPNGKILLTCVHRTDEDKKRWEARSTIIKLPHPLSGKPIGTEIANELSSLGAQPGHTVWDIAEIAKGVHKGLNLDS